MFWDMNFWISIFIFFCTFWFILSEVVHRALVALIWAIFMVLIWKYLWFYNYAQVLDSIDFNTILLLFWMMVIVAEIEKTWFFQFAAIKVAQKTQWNLWYLVIALSWLASWLSMILDNVTTIILIVPVILVITRLLKINPIPLLLSLAILSNISGVATLVWDPPNIIIGSAAGFSFNNFLQFSLPVVFVSWILVLGYIRFMYRKHWNHPQKWLRALMKMDAHKCLQSKIILRKSLIVLAWVVIGFFFHGLMDLPPSIIALIGAAVLLTWVSPHKDPKSIFKKVELSVLVFFLALFVLVWGLESAWVLRWIWEYMIAFANQNLLLTALFILWLSALLSALLDNIPMTVAMIPILSYLQLQTWSWVDLLWWALVFGVWFGWNASPIWTTTWVIVMAKSESNKTPISTKDWLLIGLPSTLISLLVASWALIVFSYFSIV